MLLAAILLTIASASWIVLYVMPRRRMTSLTRNIPGPPGLPLLGNIFMIRGSLSDIFKKYFELHEKYGSIYKFWIGPRLHVMISDPADVQCVLKNSRVINREVHITKALGQFYGDGLLTSRDDIWRRHHKLTAPAFHYKYLESYMRIFQKKANILVERLENIADGRTTDIHHAIEMCMLDAICETVLGVNMSIQENGENTLNNAFSQSEILTIHRIFNPWFLIDWLYPLSPNYKTSESLVKIIHGFSEGVIDTKLDENRDGSKKSDDLTSGGERLQSFLDIIMRGTKRGGQSLSSDEIRDEVSTIAAAGSETVITALSYALVLLGLHPEDQDQIDKELFEVFGDSDREPTMNDIAKLKHVEYCIKETLRLFPVVTFSPREISVDVDIRGGRILPAGSVAIITSFRMHRSAEYFPDPERFCPERWSPENSIGRQGNVYLPFSAGLRMCIGHKYALLAISTVLIAILRRYRVSCSSHTLDELSKNIALGVTIYSTVGYKIELHRKKDKMFN